MRVVIISHRAADPARRDRYHAMASHGVEVHLAVPHRWQPADRAEPFVTGFVRDGKLQAVPVHVRGILPGGAPARWNNRTISRIMRDVRPDMIQIEEEPHTQVAAVTTAVARRMRLATVVATNRGISAGLPIMQRRYRSQALVGAAGILAGNGAVAQQLRLLIPQAEIEVIPLEGVVPPLDPVELPREGFVVGFAGRLVADRGLDLLLRACVDLYGNWTLKVIGTGPEQEMLERLTEKLGVAARVEWLGALRSESLSLVWPSVHCLVSPVKASLGTGETSGGAILSAMAHGIPIVASRVGAYPAMVGEAGTLIEPDDQEALTEALRRLMNDVEFRAGLAGAARAWALDQHTPEALARRTVAFWRRLQDRFGSASP